MIKYETKEGFNGDVLFRVTEQTYRGTAFYKDKDEFEASNKLWVRSRISPAFEYKNNCLYTQGSDVPGDNTSVLIPAKNWPDVKQAIDEYNKEMKPKDGIWGVQNHKPMEWLMILGEEVGEANKAALEAHFGDKNIQEYRNELVQVAAVAQAAIESFDRNEGHDGESKST
jgi:hypothetical protein